MPFDTNPRNTVIFLAIFILAFFPSAFQLLLKPITYPFELFGTPLTPTPKLPTCACCPPASCYPDTLQSTTSPPPATMAFSQKTFTLPSKSRGCYLITDEVVRQLPELKSYRVGVMHLFIQHTSCALSLNENYDEDVREDMSDALDRIAPEDKKGNMYRHDAEGLDDMPAHIKSSLMGASVSVPITNGKLNTGTWQGIYYCEFRASKHSRKVVATIQGEKYT
ncbi:hypothetical protein Q7P36_001127 [Cladosporium allicinum]